MGHLRVKVNEHEYKNRHWKSNSIMKSLTKNDDRNIKELLAIKKTTEISDQVLSGQRYKCRLQKAIL